MLLARGTSRSRACCLVACASAAASLAACETVVVSMVEISDVAVVPSSITLVTGESLAASAVVTETGGEPLSGVDVTWTVDDSRVATVTSEGVVQARAPGTTMVRASRDGVTGTAAVRVLAPTDPGPTCEMDDRTIFGTFEVPRNATCFLTDVRVLGNVELRDGASLVASRLTVSGRVTANRATELVLDDSRLYGELRFENGGSVTIRESEVDRRVELRSNFGTIAVSDSWIDESLQLQENRGGPFTLLRNRTESLDCKANDPPPTGGGNVVEGREGGQCAGL